MTIDDGLMRRAHALARGSRRIAPPNPWVGCVIARDGEVIAEGATRAPGGAHAEIVALEFAGDRAKGAVLYSTLEPCCHVGRTGPCTEAIIAAGVVRVVVGVLDPDEKVAGQGVAALAEAGIEVIAGVLSAEIEEELRPYLWHRRTGRPYVVAKIASTLDGRVAMADGSSQWITSPEARADGHELRADSQAIIVGAGTVRADDPALTARTPSGVTEPLRVVLGRAPEGAKVHPCWERTGELETILDELGAAGVIQALIEGGPRTTAAFIDAGLVNRIRAYLAPAFAGSPSGLGSLEGLSTPSIGALRRGRVVDVRQIGEDLCVEVDL
jgi:diaminohydroxyphosphoribosylaminopyrimidine deaminase/5-amino-6-(5-phosphoribosylamino)uracil reductase